MDPPDLSVSALACDQHGTCAVMTLSGRAGIADAAWFRQLLELPEAQGSGRIVLDLSRLSSIDWWAALILLWVGRMVSRRGGTLVLASPQPAVARLLAAAGAAEVVTVCQSVQQACGTPGHEHSPGPSR
jgi:anti-anti-sigma factor